jgi:exopolyphosphatase/guanosine-5'-triphosphate,3'-diphosphate pyrophosphatase
MGCVSFSKRFFPDGKITKQNLKQAELAARNELQAIVGEYRGQWQQAFGSSGTAKALTEILELNGYSDGGITRAGLELLRTHMLKVGDVQNLNLQGLRPDRTPALAGGFAIMYAAFCELEIERMQFAPTALREGVLYDLWGRFHHNDMRDVTVRQFMLRYRVDARQAARVATLAEELARQFLGEEFCETAQQMLSWAASLHEIGISVAHSGYHKHTAYILKNADMPGFSKKEQARLSLLALAQRGSLEKLLGQLPDTEDMVLAMSLRLAVLFRRSRSDAPLPAMRGRFSGTKFHLSITADWLAQNPLTGTALQEETGLWKALDVSLQVQKG